MSAGTEPTRCPQCAVPMPVEGEIVMCTVCGWVPIAEIERQIRYWKARRLAALSVPLGAT